MGTLLNYRAEQPLMRNPNGLFGSLFGADVGKRLVVLSGTAEFNQTIGSIDAIRPSVIAALQREGFDVVDVRVRKSGYTRFSTILLEIEVNAYHTYTAEEVRQSAQRTIANDTRWWFGEFNYLTNVVLKVVNDFQTTTNNYPSQNDGQQPEPFDLSKYLDPNKLIGEGGGTTIILAGMLIVVLLLRK